MILAVEIQNFQSHKNTRLDFTSGVNVITGTSDSGKTAILRAIYWVLWNRPLGNGFRSHWGGDTSVMIELEDYRIKRFKGKYDSYMIQDKETEEVQEFKAFGTSVPEEVQQVLNMDDINLQKQLDQPFLLTATSGEVAMHFNKVAHLDQIDEGRKKIDSWIRQIEQDIKSNQNNRKEYITELEKYINLPKIESRVEVLEGMGQNLINAINKKRKLEQLITNIITTEDAITSKSDILNYETQVNSILNQIEQLKGKEEKNDKLISLLNSIIDIDNQITKIQELIELEPSVNSILNLYQQLEKKKDETEGMRIKTAAIEKINTKLKNKEKRLLELEEKFHQHFPDICPLCGTIITELKEHD